MNSNSFIRTLLAFPLGLLLAGCAADYVEIDRTVPPYFQPNNYFVHNQGRDALPRRILVLPCTGNATTTILRELDQAVVQELAKANIAEIIPPPQDKALHRRPSQEFSLQEAKIWAEQAGADGLLICRITSSRPHKPMVVGASVRIWNIPMETVVWSVDEMLDSQITTVANGARNYYLLNFREKYPVRRSEHILESPNMFYEYVFYELFSTIPGAATSTVPNRGVLPPPQK
jgi:hypothetical protein